MPKEFYRHLLPHFQQPGQAYFITWSLKDAVPKKALKRYSDEIKTLRLRIKSYDADPLNKIMSDSESAPPRMSGLKTLPLEPGLPELKKHYYYLRKKYIKAYDELLAIDKNPKINLSRPENLHAVKETLLFWNGKKLENYAFCIMPNHVHWVFRVFEKDEKDKLVYLQDIMNSVKRFSANQINKIENRKGAVWQAENTLNNPVIAGLVKNREDWPGNCYTW